MVVAVVVVMVVAVVVYCNYQTIPLIVSKSLIDVDVFRT